MKQSTTNELHRELETLGRKVVAGIAEELDPREYKEFQRRFDAIQRLLEVYAHPIYTIRGAIKL